MQIQPPTASGEREARELSSANLDNHSDVGLVEATVWHHGIGRKGGGEGEK